MTTALGTVIPGSLYTLPRLWDQLKQDAHYTKRLAQVQEFNKNSVWLKRGISITPCRYYSHTALLWCQHLGPLCCVGSVVLLSQCATALVSA